MTKSVLVKGKIVESIQKGEYALGVQLPTEPELADLYLVSRGTIRKVLGELEQQGIVSRRIGEGTFVIGVPKTDRAASFSQQLTTAGLRPSTQILSITRCGLECLSAYMAEAAQPHLGSSSGDVLIYKISRLRYADAHPVSWQTVYLLANDFQPNLLETQDFTHSLYELYARYHRKVAWADEIIQARLATPEEQHVLKLTDLQFVYQRERISYDQDNRLLEMMLAIDRGDSFNGYRYRIQGEGELYLTRDLVK